MAFERPPFTDCPKCGGYGTVGLVNIYSDHYLRRCTQCQHREAVQLPELDKKVVYLDQFVVSELFKLRNGTRKPNAANEEFWMRLDQSVRRAMLLQRAVFPHSDLHSDETTVSPFSQALRLAFDRLSGEVDLENHREIQQSQTWEYFCAFLDGNGPPTLNFAVDEILHGNRNAWLPDIVLSVNMDYSQFADQIRKRRDSLDQSMLPIFRRWQSTKPTFEEVLHSELAGIGAGKRSALRTAIGLIEKGINQGDPQALIDGSLHAVYVEFRQMQDTLHTRGMALNDAMQEVTRFWDWSGLAELPHHKIAAHLYAGIARKLVAGQRKLPTRGFSNDVQAIATYAPYVDAMFVDRECAALVKEQPLSNRLGFSSTIYSLSSGDEFIQYLDSLSDSTPDDVSTHAHQLYGI
jgi:transcription elongation factor Elf1